MRNDRFENFNRQRDIPQNYPVPANLGCGTLGVRSPSRPRAARPLSAALRRIDLSPGAARRHRQPLKADARRRQGARMFEVRIHGRGGQGVVTAAEMLSVAAFLEGKHAQAFPSFGSERTGAPVVSFCRISDFPIRVHEPIAAPDGLLIIQDPTLLHQVDVFGGLHEVTPCADQHSSAPCTISTSRTCSRDCRPGHVQNCRRKRARAQGARPANAECGVAGRLRGADPGIFSIVGSVLAAIRARLTGAMSARATPRAPRRRRRSSWSPQRRPPPVNSTHPGSGEQCLAD